MLRRMQRYAPTMASGCRQSFSRLSKCMGILLQTHVPHHPASTSSKVAQQNGKTESLSPFCSSTLGMSRQPNCCQRGYRMLNKPVICMAIQMETKGPVNIKKSFSQTDKLRLKRLFHTISQSLQQQAWVILLHKDQPIQTTAAHYP